MSKREAEETVQEKPWPGPGYTQQRDDEDPSGFVPDVTPPANAEEAEKQAVKTLQEDKK